MNIEVLYIIEQQLGKSQSTTAGQYKFHCPFCNHRKHKLEVNLDKNVWHCWVCHSKGRSVQSLLYKLHVHSSIIEEVNQLIPNTKKYVSIENKDETILTLPKEFIQLSNKNNFVKEDYDFVLNYLLETRGLTLYDIFRYNIGYCITGDYAKRIIIPNYDKNNQLNFFVGRNYNFKNVNTINYNTPSVSKKEIIGFENHVNFKLPIYLVEGSFDAITIRHNSIPLFGTIINRKIIKQFIINNTPEIYIILDLDAKSNAMKIVEYLFRKLPNTKIYLIELNGKDPSKLGFKNTWNIINNSTPITKIGMMKLKLK